MSSTSQIEPLYRISEVARILHVSRSTVYNWLRGYRIIDLAPKGKRNGVKLVPESVLQDLLKRSATVYR